MSKKETRAVVAPKIKVVVAVSGRGRSLENLIKVSCHHRYVVVAVITSHKDCPGAHIATQHSLPLFVGEFPKYSAASKPASKKREAQRDEDLRGFLQQHSAELVVLAGFVRPFPVHCADNIPVINIHPSLLPRHGGPGLWGDRVHRAVLEAGSEISGASCHLATAQYDSGAVLSQVVVAVRPGEDVQHLAQRIFQWEKQLLPHTIDLFASVPQAKKTRSQKQADT